MKNKNGKQLRKRGCALFFAAALFVAGIGSAPIVGEAAPYGEAGSNPTYEDKIWYEKDTTAFNALWTESTKGVPTKDGYVFGGWCTQNKDGETYTMLTEETASEAMKNNTEVYAKYVPAYVLSVRAQVDTDTYTKEAEREEKKDEEGKLTKAGSIRLVSATDSKEYQKVGFDVYLGGKTANKVWADAEKTKPLETNKVYNRIQTADDKKVDATTAFGTHAEFLSVWKLDKIVKDNDTKIMKVTPYWITLDGTKVTGLTKYVHMEDGYKSHMYVSVPITLRATEEVAAGMVTVTYPEGLELIRTDKEVEDGDIFPAGQMSYKCDPDTRTIQFVANGKNTEDEISASGLYANLRFKKTAEISGHLEFTFSGEQFCNWNEEIVNDINAWDIQY